MRHYLRNGRNALSRNAGTHLRRAQQMEQRMVPNDAHSTTAQLGTNAFNTGWLRRPCVPEDNTKRQGAREHACMSDITQIMNTYNARCNGNFAWGMLTYTTTYTFVFINANARWASKMTTH
eukprot:1548028-Lingulodinium_polyedra.AAC.1